MSDSRCQVCRAETDGTLCNRCLDAFGRTLDAMRDLLPELVTHAARQSRVHRAARRVEQEPEADVATNAATGTDGKPLSAFLRSKTAPSALAPQPLPVDLATAELATTTAAYLAADWSDLATHPDAGTWFTRAAKIAARAESAVDLTETRVWRGICDAPVNATTIDGDTIVVSAGVRPCGADLYAFEGAATVQCDGYRPDGVKGEGCRTWHDLDAIHDGQVLAVREWLWSLPEILAALPYLLGTPGYPVAEAHLPGGELWRKWRERRQLVDHGRDDQGRRTYLVGDVIDLAQGYLDRPKPRR